MANYKFLPLILICNVFCFTLLNAQILPPDSPPDIFSLDSIQKGIEMHDRGNYDSAITLYNYVHPNDTNFALAQYELSLSLSAKEQHQEALDAALIALDKSDSADASYLISVGNSYDDLGQHQNALRLYTEALEKFPYSYLVYYNRAVTYGRIEKHQEALEDLKRSVELNPFHASSHLLLATYALNEEQYAQALLSVGYFLMVEPNSGRTNAVLTLFNNAVSDNTDLESKNIKISESPEAFKKINLLIRSYAALRKDYKTESDLNVALVNQMDLNLRQSMSLSNTNDFWINYYLPFYREVLDHGYFEEFSYLISASSANDKHQKIIKKNLDDILEFISWAIAQLKDSHGLHPSNYDQSKPEVRYWFYEDANSLEAIGSPDVDGKRDGEYIFLTTQGTVNARGQYKDGERDGDWEFYYSNGKKLFTGHFVNGKLQGPATRYFDNGRIEKELNYKDGYYHGITRIYDKSGYLQRYMYHQEGNIEDSLVYFYSTGARSAFLPITKDIINGEARYYFADGQLSGLTNYEEDLREGKALGYYADKILSYNALYSEGKLHGKYESFYINGKVESSGNYDEGIQIGAWETYYYDGTRASVAEYDEAGKQSGHQEYFDENGNLSVAYEYTKGEITEYKHFDKEGNIIHSDSRKKGKFWYEDYTLTGVKTAEGNYFGDHKEGDWRYFTDNGVLSGEENFNAEGELDGECRYYHDNGKLSVRSHYRRDTLQGLYLKYFDHGTLLEHGHYRNGKLNGEWRTYYPDGTLKNIKFYQGGKMNGEQLYFDVAGVLMRKELYDRGEPIALTAYAEDSSITNDQKIDVSSDTIIEYYPNNKVAISIPYVGGELNGMASWYHANGQLMREGNYLTDAAHGLWKYYYANGNLKEERNYHLGELTGKLTEYHLNGKVSYETQYENGKRHGETKLYHFNGKLDTKSNYNQGKYHGKRYFYDLEGNLGHIRFYDHGRIIGYSYLDEDGNEKPMIPIIEETATVMSYFSNGEIARQYTLDKGMLQGEYLTFNMSGTSMEKMNFVDGNYHAIRETYYADGSIQGRSNYEHGILDGEFTTYHPNGKISQSGFYRNNELHGIYSEYDQKGVLSNRYLYRNGDVYKILPKDD